jgi:hypothetical protein
MAKVKLWFNSLIVTNNHLNYVMAKEVSIEYSIDKQMKSIMKYNFYLIRILLGIA